MGSWIFDAGKKRRIVELYPLKNIAQEKSLGRTDKIIAGKKLECHHEIREFVKGNVRG